MALALQAVHAWEWVVVADLAAEGVCIANASCVIGTFPSQTSPEIITVHGVQRSSASTNGCTDGKRVVQLH